MKGFEANRRLTISAGQRAGAELSFDSARVDTATMADTIRWAQDKCGQLIDPHTAIGLAAARASRSESPVVTLATAHPAKFPDAVERASGQRPALPCVPTACSSARSAMTCCPPTSAPSKPSSLPAPGSARRRPAAGARGPGMTPVLGQTVHGLRVATWQTPGVETVAVALHAETGARFETAEHNGLAHLFEHMVFKGTTTRNARAIAEQIEDVGGNLNAWTSRDTTVFHARLLARDLPLGLDVITDLVSHPRFDEGDLEREKDVVLQELGEARDTPDDIVFDHLQEAAFPGQALGRSILGSEESLARLTTADLFDWQARHYTPERLTLVVAGKVDHDSLMRLAEAAFPASGSVAPATGARDGAFRPRPFQ